MSWMLESLLPSLEGWIEDIFSSLVRELQHSVRWKSNVSVLKVWQNSDYTYNQIHIWIAYHSIRWDHNYKAHIWRLVRCQKIHHILCDGMFVQFSKWMWMKIHQYIVDISDKEKLFNYVVNIEMNNERAQRNTNVKEYQTNVVSGYLMVIITIIDNTLIEHSVNFK